MKEKLVQHFEERLGAPHASLSDRSAHFIVSALRDRPDECGCTRPFWAFKRKDCLIVSVSPAIAESLPINLQNFTFENIAEDPLFSAVRATVSQQIPLKYFHLQHELFCTTDVFKAVAAGDVRPLTPRGAVEITEMDPDLEPVVREPIEKAEAFGISENEQLLSFSWIKHHTEYASDVFVYTRPDRRRQGLGKKTLSAAVQKAMSDGSAVVMTVGSGDKAGLMVARSLGFSRYAKSIIALSKAVRPV